MSPLTACESLYEKPTGRKCSYTVALKLMDQLKGFVGMAIFLSQMATCPGITSVSNSVISARRKSFTEMDPLSGYPQSEEEAHGEHEGSADGTCYFLHNIYPTLFLPSAVWVAHVQRSNCGGVWLHVVSVKC